MHVTFRISDPIGARVLALASEHKVKPSDMWRLLVMRGLDAESTLTIKYLVESLCVTRRLAASVDIELLKKAQADADDILARLGVIDFQKREAP